MEFWWDNEFYEFENINYIYSENILLNSKFIQTVKII